MYCQTKAQHSMEHVLDEIRVFQESLWSKSEIALLILVDTFLPHRLPYEVRRIASVQNLGLHIMKYLENEELK